ncbi:MAG: helix-turn-helix transcriptional regulator [Lachnospiraceae bacterium]|nr:helix-turn-helix transcriptional regulator [Lachnospiraceae bacterium]
MKNHTDVLIFGNGAMMKKAVNYCSLGANIRKYREEKGLSAEKLSTLSNVSKSHINNIESANSKPSLEVLVRIANALDVSLDVLVCDSLYTSKHIKMMEYAIALDNCNEGEVRLIVETTKILKRELKNLM